MLVAYQTGELTETSADAVTLHVASCPACQAELKTIRDSEDTLVNQLRASRSQQEPFLDEPGCAAAVAQVQAAVSSLIASEADSTVTISLPPDLRPVGEYQLLGKLGEGGMGAVYKARQTNLGRLVALKVLPKERCQDQAAIARFYREMQAVGRLRHPNIVEALDAREIDGVPVLAMEYVEGIDLSKLVAQVGPLAVPDACELMRQTALGLQHAHEHGLVHRDIKPSNLMLRAALPLSGKGTGGEGHQVLVKILDLGLALLDTSRPQDSEMTAAGSAMGTADYMAPEQVTDSHAVDIRADLYSLGCTLYKLLSGHAPFADSPSEGAFHKMMAHVNRPAPSIRQRRPDVPEELAAVLQRLLAKQPDERFATPAEVAAALAPLAAGCDLPGLLRRATGTTPADLQDAMGGTDKYRSSAFVGTDAQPRKGAASATLPRPWSRIPKLPAAIGLAALALLVLGIVFYLRDGRQTVKVEIDAELVKDATVTVWLDGREMEVRGLGETIRLKPGEHGYEIRRGDQIIRTQEFSVVRGENPALRIALEKSPTAGMPPAPADARAVAGKPHGTQIAIEDKPGLPDEDGADAATADDAGLWAPGPAKDILLGLVPQPAKLFGVKRWQIDTVAPRADCFSVSWSPDGRLVAWGGYDPVRVYDSQTGHLTRRLSDGGPCQFSPDGKWLGVASWSCAQLWDVRTGRLAINIPGQGGMFSRIAWSPDSSRFVTGGFWGDQSIRVCGIDGKILKAWKLPGMVSDIAWSPDGKWLASSCPEETENRVRLWTPDGEPGPVLDFAAMSAMSLAWSPDGRWLAAGSNGRDVSRICLWDTSTWKTAHAWEEPGEYVLDLSWSPDSRRLVFTAPSKPARIWDIEANSVKAIFAGPHKLQNSFVAWNRQGTQIAVGSTGHFGTFLCLWDVNSEKPGAIVGSERQPLACLVPSPDGKWLATLSSDGKDGRLWTAEGLPGAPIAVQTRRLPDTCLFDPGMAWAWNPDGSEAAILGDDTAIRLWKPASAEPARLLRGHTARIRAIDWSRDGKRLVSGGEDRIVRIWDPVAGSILDILAGHAGPVDQVAWSPDGKHVASRSSDPEDPAVRVWTTDGKAATVIEGHQGGTKGMAWSPDGTQIATFGNAENDPVRVWNAADGKVVLELKEAYRNLESLSWSPDNAWLAVVGSDIHVWQRDGTLGRVLKDQGYLREVGSVAWSPDSKWFATAGFGTVCVWSPHQAQPVVDGMGHPGQMTGLCWSPDSRYLVSAGRDGTLRRWHALTGKQISTSVVLPDGSAAYISQGGKLETTSPEAEKHLVYVVEQPDGEYKLFTPGEFRSTVEANGK